MKWRWYDWVTGVFVVVMFVILWALSYEAEVDDPQIEVPTTERK